MKDRSGGGRAKIKRILGLKEDGVRRAEGSVKEDNGEESTVTVRLYGPNTDYVINRERELQAIKYLSAAGFGAKLLGLFGNGMVHSFINARILTPAGFLNDETFHGVPFLLPDTRVPKLAVEIAKELRRFHAVEIPRSKEPQLWNEIFKFFETEKLYLIDFVYESYNYRGFDIGNHFNEYAGYDCDYSLYVFSISLPSCPDNSSDPEKVSSKDLEVLYVESNKFMLASLIFWALWALIEAKMSPIDFNYLGYFFLRYNEYRLKEEMNCLLA
ncbi:unnamed protein product [Linum tenue]|uniref:ethanolamine kinase n=1 Tax=Linum tenue TaxID=586396 RepID=A0AAV0SBJ9_9ROSI|nr:unnamed protein product [Linum tenue]